MEHIEKRMVSESDRKTLYNGANWFYWLAALSAINSLIVFFVGTPNLPISFGVTQWFDGTTGPLSAPPLEMSKLIMDLIVAAAFAGFGYLARRSDVAFVIGIVLYAIDALLSLGHQGILRICVSYRRLLLPVSRVACEQAFTRERDDDIGLRLGTDFGPRR